MAIADDMTGECESLEPLNAGAGKTTLLSMISSLGAVLAACSCCILPMALAGLGVSAGLGSFVSPLGPMRWPITAFAAIAVAASWLIVVRQRRGVCPCGPREVFLSRTTLQHANLASGPSNFGQNPARSQSRQCGLGAAGQPAHFYLSWWPLRGSAAVAPSSGTEPQVYIS